VLKLPTGFSLCKPKISKGRQLSTLDVLSYRVTQEPSGPDRNFLVVGKLWSRRAFFIHQEIGPSKQKVVCLRSFDEPCPICEEHARVDKDVESSKEKEQALRAKGRECYNVIDLDDDPNKVMILDMSVFCFGDQLEKDIISSPDEDVIGHFLLKKGYTLKVRFDEGEMPNGRPFPKAGRFDFVPRQDYDPEILECVLDLDKLLIDSRLGYDELEALMHGTTVRKNAPVETGEQGGREQSRESRFKRSVRAVEPGEPPDNETGPVEQEPEPPARTRFKRAEADELHDEPGPVDDGDSKECPACVGKGKNSKGGTCIICKGTGKVRNLTPRKEEPPEPEEQASEDTPTPPRRLARGAAPSETKPRFKRG
jgi:hypothetical protein